MDAVYALVSELHRLVSTYDVATLKRAHDHVARSFAGRDQEAFLAILSALITLKGTGETASAPDPVPYGGTEPPPKVREVHAILGDETFLAGKRDVLLLLSKLHGFSDVRSREKESRAEIVDKAVSCFRRADPAKQEKMYQAIRKAYLRGRKSGLRDWSEIIADSPTEK